MHKTLIDPSTLARHLHDPDWIVVDCRFDLTNPEKGEELYREAHIPGARYAHLDRHLSGPKTGKNGRHPLPDSEVLCRTFSDLGISPGTQVVAYDADSGMYAGRLWWMLRWMGHDAAAVLDGGLARWQREGHPVRGGVESSTSRHFKGAPRPGWRLSVDDVADHRRRPHSPARRFAYAGSVSRHRRNPRQGWRPHSRRRELLFPAEPDRGQDLQIGLTT